MNDFSYAFRFLLLLDMYSIWPSNFIGAIKGSKGDIFGPSVTIYKMSECIQIPFIHRYMYSIWQSNFIGAIKEGKETFSVQV